MKKFFLPVLFSLSATISLHAQYNGTIGDSIFWNITGDELVVAGNCDLPTFTFEYAPWYDLRNGVKSIRMEGGIKSISEFAFYEFTNVTSVLIPNTVTTIKQNAFLGCSSLPSISLPASVHTVHNIFVQSCLSLTEILVDPQNKNFSSEDGVLFDKDMKILRACPAGKKGNYSIPESVITIDEYAFNFSKISSVTIPASVISIGLFSFAVMSNLVEIVNKNPVPQSTHEFTFDNLDYTKCVLQVPAGSEDAYAHTARWEKFTDIKGFQTGKDGAITWSIINGELAITGNGAIPEYRFAISIFAPWYEFQTAINSIRIGEGITVVSQDAFYRLGKVTSVSFPKTLTAIGENAFIHCYSLTSISIPALVSSIGPLFVQDCPSLNEILVDPENKYYCSVNGVLFNKNMTTIVFYPTGKGGGSFSIPETVTTIGNNAFLNSKLTSVTIPASVSTINTLAFANCSKFTEIINKRTTPQPVIPSVFMNFVLDNCTVRVPSASVHLYKNADVWSEFQNIVAIEEEIPEIEIKLDKKEIYLLTGATTTITAIVSNGGTVTWSSSDITVATVDHAGTVTAVKVGEAVITASVASCETTCSVTVLQPGNSTIKGNVNNSGTEDVRVNLYKKPPESDTKKGIIGGYVLLATTIPNDYGDYKFENLPEGSYKVDVEIDDYESESSLEINISDNETRSNIDFEVDGATGTVVPKILTGAVETWHAASLQIYPNPFTDVVRIIVGAGLTPAQRIQVINTAGTIVHTQIITGIDETIHLGHLPAGIYIIRLENNRMAKSAKVFKFQ